MESERIRRAMKKFELEPDSKAWFCWNIQEDNSCGIVDNLSNGYKYVESYFPPESEETVFRALSQTNFFTDGNASIKILEKSCCPDVLQIRTIHQNEDADDITKDCYPSVEDKRKRGEDVDIDLVEKMKNLGVNPDWIADFSHGPELTFREEHTLITGWKDILPHFRKCYYIREDQILQQLCKKGYFKCPTARIFVCEYRKCPPPNFSIPLIAIDEVKNEIEGFSDNKQPYLPTIEKIKKAGLDPFFLVKIRHNLWSHDSYLTIDTLLSGYDLISCEMIKSGLPGLDEKDFFDKISSNQTFIYKGVCIESLFAKDRESRTFLDTSGLTWPHIESDSLDYMDSDDIDPCYIDGLWKRLLDGLSLTTQFLLSQRGKLVLCSENYILIAVTSLDSTRIVQSKAGEIKKILSEILKRPYNVIILGPEKSNINNINELLIDKFHEVKPILDPLQWENLHFLSEQEVRVAKALDAQGVLFFPNAGCRINSGKFRKTRTPDFLVVIDGYLGILECDSRTYHPSAADDHERDRLFQKHGIRFIQRYSYERCRDEKNVVDEFIKMMVAHFRIRL